MGNILEVELLGLSKTTGTLRRSSTAKLFQDCCLAVADY